MGLQEAVEVLPDPGQPVHDLDELRAPRVPGDLRLDQLPPQEAAQEALHRLSVVSTQHPPERGRGRGRGRGRRRGREMLKEAVLIMFLQSRSRRSLYTKKRSVTASLRLNSDQDGRNIINSHVI